MIDTLMQDMVEQIQQLLEYPLACFILGCSDASLRHPLLFFLPHSPSCYPSGQLERGLWQDEQVRLLSDMALQSGCIQVIQQALFLEGFGAIQSLAAVPLESQAGLLGVVLLADREAGRLGAGEERLLHTYLSIQLYRIETGLWEWVRKQLLMDNERGEEAAVERARPEAFLRNELASLIGHELRAPLSIIKGYAGLLQVFGEPTEQQTATLSPDRRHQYLEVILRQVDLLERLLNDFLDISRLQHGKLTLHPDRVDLTEICQNVIQLGQMRADQQGAGLYQLQCSLPTHLPSLVLDAGRLQQVLFNLLENAIKYSPEGGKIELEARILAGNQGSESIALTVRDQGVGIPAQHMPSLFQPFERLGQANNQRIAGSGLGLYLAHTLIKAMQGEIEIQSREGHGTAVTITLPLQSIGAENDLVREPEWLSSPIG